MAVGGDGHEAKDVESAGEGPGGVLRSACALDGRLQRVVLAFELRVSGRESIRTTTTQPQYSVNEGRLNGERYTVLGYRCRGLS